jgi:hypothetical protein
MHIPPRKAKRKALHRAQFSLQRTKRVPDAFTLHRANAYSGTRGYNSTPKDTELAYP